MAVEADPSAGLSKGFSPVSFSDHAGNVWIITILSLAYSSSVAAVRVYTKMRMYGIDDALIGVAMVLHLGQAIALFIGLNNSFAKFNSITDKDQWTTSSRVRISPIPSISHESDAPLTERSSRSSQPRLCVY